MASLRTVRPPADVVASDRLNTHSGLPETKSPFGGIVFDVPDVLYDATLWRRWLLQLINRLGAGIGYADFDQAWEAQLVDVFQGRREYREALQTLLLSLGLSWAQIDEIEAAGRIQRKNLELNVRSLPGATRAVNRLAGQGIPLIAWADVPHSADRLGERLDRLGLGGRFQTVLTSFDLERVQPDPECYRAMLAACQTPAERVLYVGHDACHLAGAQRAGLRTAAYNFAPTAQADHYLTNLDELLALVAKPGCPAKRLAA